MARRESKAKGLQRLALSRAKQAMELARRGACKGAVTATLSADRAVKSAAKLGGRPPPRVIQAANTARRSVGRVCDIER